MSSPKLHSIELAPDESKGRVSFSRPQLRALPSKGPPTSQTQQFTNATVFFNGIGFCSLSEAVCAALLELYVPGYKVEPGKTFQVEVGSGRTVDFLIKGVLCEFHGIRLTPDRRGFGDFRDRAEFQSFRRELRRVGRHRHRRRQLIQQTKARLAELYFARRRSVIDSQPAYAACELIVATTVEQFYERIIVRFNKGPWPLREDFVDSFYTLAGIIAKSNASGRRSQRRRIA